MLSDSEKRELCIVKGMENATDSGLNAYYPTDTCTVEDMRESLSMVYATAVSHAATDGLDDDKLDSLFVEWFAETIATIEEIKKHS